MDRFVLQGVWVLALGLVGAPASANSDLSFGPSRLPAWHEDAQVALGWDFVDSKDPSTTAPEALSGAIRFVGAAAPQWDYDPNRTVMGDDARWFVHVPNVPDENPVKHFWLSYVVERDTGAAGAASVMNLSWYPDRGYGNWLAVEEWFDANGAPLDSFNPANASLAAYSRVTISMDLYPNPQFEDIWIGVAGGEDYDLTEAYLLTECDPVASAMIPEPITCLSLATALLVSGRYVRRRA